MTKKRVSALVLFFMGIGVALYAFQLRKGTRTPIEQRAHQLSALWKADLDILKSSNSLPPAFFDISDIEFQTTRDELKAFVAQYKPGIETKPNGQNKLHIFLDELPDEKGVIVRYDLVENAKGNTIWELSRTIPATLTR